ncbi:MAG: HlyD family type I secretion periplasmic adaptor subunit [Rhodobacteraceae bacterium]|nr:HlyD family type I secretion periplasmic adaptor subunit [Paracoccaceae bacterium]
MFVRQVEEQYVNDVGAAGQSALYQSRWAPVMLIALITGAFLIWAAIYEVEEVTRGAGRVIPSSQLQVIQSLEGGLVSDIAVAEGDAVEAGQVLMQIDATGFAAQQGELQRQAAALLAERARLEAEVESRPLRFDPAFAAANPLASAAETEVYLSRRRQFEAEMEVLRDRLSQRESELAELNAQQEKRRQVIAPLSEERALIADLFAQDAVPRIELLRIESRLAELRGDLAVGTASRARLEAAIRQARSEIAQARSAYVLTARERLARLQVELAVVQETLKAADDRVLRTQLRSPVRGTVNRVMVTTKGAVVQPGAPVAEIVPLDDGLLIEANLLPSDVAFIKPGDKVAVKITAYDYLVYGALDGEVARLGADTITDPEGREFFKVVVRTARGYLGTADAPLPITPGMTASIDIQTGQKSIMDYLLKPIRRAGAEALRER